MKNKQLIIAVFITITLTIFMFWFQNTEYGKRILKCSGTITMIEECKNLTN